LRQSAAVQNRNITHIKQKLSLNSHQSIPKAYFEQMLLHRVIAQ